MERAPVTAATGALGPVVAKLGALLGREYKLRRPTRKDVKFIKSKLKSVHSILWAIWDKEILDSESKVLKKEALDVADDVHDAIDDFILTMEPSRRNKHLMVQSKIEASCPFQDLKKRVDDVSGRCRSKWKWEKNKSVEPFSSLFSRRNSKSSPPSKPLPPRAPFVHKDAAELVGMDIWRDELITFLVGGGGGGEEEEEEEEETTTVPPQLKMASIVGMAGMGKTTLAHLVYEDEEIKSKFQSRAFVSVTPNPNMKEVLTSILQQVGAEPLAGTQARTQEDLIHTISNFLENKRYLVIIDDIWHREEWDIIRRSFPQNNLGSRIVITTRIASLPGDDFDNSKLYIEMNPIWSSLKKRWLYGFYRKDVTTQMKPDMVGQGFDGDHPIVRMCGGVPSALLCMFSAMAMVREQQEQLGVHVKACNVQDMIEKQVKRNGFQNTQGFEPLVESLQLGYADLPHHMLKTCLLYCSVYPENYPFHMNDLVMRWVAEGFTYKEDIAKGYLEELCNRGLMLRLEGLSDMPDYQMNPMMRNFLRWKSREDNFITCSSGIRLAYACRVHRLCIDDYQVDDGEVQVVDTLLELDWSQIRSLVVFEGAERCVPFEKLERVRVLDLQYHHHYLKFVQSLWISVLWISALEFEALGNQHVKDICGLLRVRHLFGLEGTGISEIPPEIARLQHLETLQVRFTSITELPSEIRDLQQLKTLAVSPNRKLTELPREIGGLQQLETLDLNWTRLTELPREIGKLQNLKRLLLSGTGVTKIPREIEGLKKLEILKLDNTISALPWEASQLLKLEGVPECVRQAWKKSDLVSELAREILSVQLINWLNESGGLIVGRKHMGIPGWIKDHFKDLGSLDIRMCKLEEQDLKILREMPNLKFLTLRLEVVPRDPIAISREGFPCLRELVVDSRMPRVVTFQEGAMPELQKLVFEFQFYGGPPAPANKDPQLGIKHLRDLWWVEFRCSKEWYGGAAESRSPCMSAMIDVVRKEAQEHPRDICFRVSGREDEDFPANEESAQSSSSGTSEINDTPNGGRGEIQEEEEETFPANESGKVSGSGTASEIEEEEIHEEEER
ncbi:unnamed protein product [Triticum turgidum subsp. durum]|uniref:Uncharacterized protein n=1 Tax=Triticum turgidum subsp. durum TaxID=4567 RepID=A0A9R0Z117_TRITD|nr:unnamed protein product [Triticum turgidum subsp. durum]